MRVLRGASAFLLAFHAVSQVELLGPGGPAALALGLVALAGLAGLFGEGPSRGVVQRDRAATYRVGSLWALYALILIASLLLASSGEEELTGASFRALELFELLFLAWPSVGPRGVPLLLNSLALCTLSALHGGPLASAAVGGHAPLVAAFLVADQHEMRGAPARSALLPMLGHALFAGLLTWPLLSLLPAAAGGSLRSLPELPASSWGELSASYGELLVWGLLGLGLILAVGWLLERLLRERRELSEEELEASAREEALVSLGPPPGGDELDLSGARGRIIRTFEAFLVRCHGLGHERRSHWTALEFARRMPAPAIRLARLFGRARYSLAELSEGDAEAAAADAALVIERLPRA